MPTRGEGGSPGAARSDRSSPPSVARALRSRSGGGSADISAGAVLSRRWLSLRVPSRTACSILAPADGCPAAGWTKSSVHEGSTSSGGSLAGRAPSSHRGLGQTDFGCGTRRRRWRSERAVAARSRRPFCDADRLAGWPARSKHHLPLPRALRAWALASSPAASHGCDARSCGAALAAAALVIR
jgi:hypothetical protein